MIDDIKVGYVMLDGFKSTAYIEYDSESDVHHGTNKHTDDPVSVQWDADEEEWFEVQNET